MKGLEALPIRMMASLILIAVVVSVSFYELDTFFKFQKERKFKEELVNFRQAIRTLQSLGDKGSFTSIEFNIPGGYSIFIDNQTNQIIGVLGNENFIVNLTCKLKALQFPSGCNATGCLLKSAYYEIRLIYGSVEHLKNYSIVFE